MHFAAATKMSEVSAEVLDPFHEAVAVVENKIKKLHDMGNLIESYKISQKNGAVLSQEQLSMVARLADIQDSLKHLTDIQKQFDQICEDAERDRQQLAVREELERTHQDVAKIKEILLFQDILGNMRRDGVRKDFLTGQNGAVKLTEEALDDLDDFYDEISLVGGVEVEFPDFRDQLQQSAQHLLALVEGRETEIIGTTYSKLKELIMAIHMCGYFEHVTDEDSAIDSDAAQNGEDEACGSNGSDAEDNDVDGKVDACHEDEKFEEKDSALQDTKLASDIQDAGSNSKGSDCVSGTRKSKRVKVASRRYAEQDWESCYRPESDDNSDVERKPHHCLDCSRGFSSYRRLKLHICDRTDKKKSFHCASCNDEFRSKDSLKEHMFTHMYPVHNCTQCEETFTAKASLQEHILTHHTNKKMYSCRLCHDEFASVGNLRKHKRTHSPETRAGKSKKHFYCHECGAGFSDKDTLENHVVSHFVDKPFLCFICKATFSRKDSLTTHLHSVHAIENTFSCDICGATFLKGDELKSHASSHPDRKPLHCTVCQAMFYKKTNLTAHMRTHIVKKRFICSLCGEKCSSFAYLRVHVRAHTIKNPLTCPICRVTFSKKEYVKKHLVRHCDMEVLPVPDSDNDENSDGTEKPITWMCKFCDVKFTRKGELVLHLHDHDDEKRFACDVCGGKFIMKTHLASHMRTHSDINPYSCSVCKATFGHRSTLKHHVRVHSGEKPYRCTRCGSSYSRKDNLKAHMFIHFAKKFSDKFNIG